MKEGLAWEEPMDRLACNHYAFMLAYDFTRFGYPFERNESRLRDPVARTLASEAEIAAEDGAWTLFRARPPVGLADAPDAPLLSPAPEALDARIARRGAPP